MNLLVFFQNFNGTRCKMQWPKDAMYVVYIIYIIIACQRKVSCRQWDDLGGVYKKRASYKFPVDWTYLLQERIANIC